MKTDEVEEVERLEEARARAEAMLERDPAEAAAIASEACEIAERIGDEAGLGESHYLRGTARLRMASYSEAESDLRRALEISREHRLVPLTLRSLRKLLQVAFFTRNPDAALLRGLQALQIAREVGEWRAEAEAHNDLGLVYGNVGDYEGALEHLLAGLRIMREDGAAKLGSLLNNVGNVYLELEDHREAFGFFQSALEAFREEGSRIGEAIALGNLGRASAALRRHEEALDWYRRSLGEFEHAGDVRYRPPAFARLGTSLAELARYEEAEAAFHAAFEMLERSVDREFEDEVLVAAAHFELLRGRPDEAIGLLSRAATIVPADETTRRLYELQNALGEAHERRGDLAAALRHYKEFHRVRQAVSDFSLQVRVRGLMLQFDVERARQQEEIYRLKNVELVQANLELRELQAQLEERNQELHRITIEDALTGLYNRRYLDLQLPKEVSRARRHGIPLCVAMCDIDHFKVINDEHSHAIGDEVLRRIANIFRANARAADIVFRFGGEEFLMILPETALAGAETLAERIRAGIAAERWDEVAAGLLVTLSIGIAELGPSRGDADLLADADARLYEAKRSGRDRIVT